MVDKARKPPVQKAFVHRVTFDHYDAHVIAEAAEYLRKKYNTTQMQVQQMMLEVHGQEIVRVIPVNPRP